MTVERVLNILLNALYDEQMKVIAYKADNERLREEIRRLSQKED